MSDVDDSAAEWQRLVDRFPSQSPEQTLARALCRRVAVVVIAAMVALLIGIAVVALHNHVGGGSSAGAERGHRMRREEAPLPLQIVSFGLLVIGLAVEVVGLLRLRRRGVLRDNWRSPLLALPWREQRQVIAQVRGRRPTPPEDLALVRGLARRLVNQAQLWPVWAGLIIFLAGQLLTARGSQLVVLLCVLVLFGMSFPLLLRDVRAGRRFLAEHSVE